VSVELTGAPCDYAPGACDCEFCHKHGASYISDPKGAIKIEVENAERLGKYRQGNGIADCLFCTECGVLLGILYQENGHLYATANSRALISSFGENKPISPKLLTASEKISRWQELWFSNVTLALHNNKDSQHKRHS
jgi:hypothetical protein